MKAFWRWVAVFPAAIGAYFAAILVLNLLLLLEGGQKDEFGLPWLLNNFRDVTDIIFRAGGVYFYVIAGVAVAPKGKYPTALALSIIVWTLSALGLIVILVLRIQVTVINLVEIPFLCGAAVIACIQEYKKEKQRKLAETQFNSSVSAEPKVVEATKEASVRLPEEQAHLDRVQAAWENVQKIREKREINDPKDDKD